MSRQIKEITVGDITLKRLSTVSVIVVIITDKNGTDAIGITYDQFEQLKEAIKSLQ